MAPVATQVTALGGVTWECRSDWSRTLLGAEGLRLSDWLRDGQAQIVKDAPHRVVYRVDLGERAFFVKRYRSRDARSLGRRALLASPARREWSRTAEVARRQVPTARSLAVGESRGLGLAHDDYLITEAIPQSVTVEDFVDRVLPQAAPSERVRTRQKLAQALAEFLAATHQAGVMHDDLHAGNMLIRWDASDFQAIDERLPELFLIDLPSVRFSGALDWRRSRQSLAMFSASWRGRASRTDLWRFFVAYLAARPDLGLLEPRELARDTWRRGERHFRGVLRGRDRRCERENRDFQVFGNSKFRGHAIVGVAPELGRALADDPESPIRDHFDQVAKIGHGSIVTRGEWSIDGQPTAIAYKRTRAKAWWKRLLGLPRPSRATRGWRMANALRSRGIPTARPLLVLEPKRWWALERRAGYLATAWIEDALDLHLYAWRIEKLDPVTRRDRVRRLAESLGRLVGRLHAWGFEHRDLKGCNILVRERSGGVDCLLIDVDGVRFAKRGQERKQADNLARLSTSARLHPWITRADRVRFLRAYSRELGLSRSSLGRLWRRVGSASLAWEKHFRRAGKSFA